MVSPYGDYRGPVDASGLIYLGCTLVCMLSFVGACVHKQALRLYRLRRRYHLIRRRQLAGGVELRRIGGSESPPGVRTAAAAPPSPQQPEPISSAISSAPPVVLANTPTSMPPNAVVDSDQLHRMPQKSTSDPTSMCSPSPRATPPAPPPLKMSSLSAAGADGRIAAECEERRHACIAQYVAQGRLYEARQLGWTEDVEPQEEHALRI